MAAATRIKQGGRFYLWVYGPGSMVGSPVRLTAYASEAVLRPALRRLPSSIVTIMLSPIALAYLTINLMRRLGDPSVQAYNLNRALHAARDRHTPRFAYRHSVAKVKEWFDDAGYGDLEVIVWRDIPSPALA
jgi:hypothetical protein